MGVLVVSGRFWWSLVQFWRVLARFLWVLVSSAGFWLVLLVFLWVLVGSGRVLVGSCEFW